MEEHRTVGNLIDQNPGPEARTAGDCDVAYVDLRGADGQASQVTIVVVDHVQVGVLSDALTFATGGRRSLVMSAETSAVVNVASSDLLAAKD